MSLRYEDDAPRVRLITGVVVAALLVGAASLAAAALFLPPAKARIAPVPNVAASINAIAQTPFARRLDDGLARRAAQQRSLATFRDDGGGIAEIPIDVAIDAYVGGVRP